MRNRTGWLSIVALIAAGLVAYALGAPPLTLLIIGILLLCPVAIYFAMREMQAGPDAPHRSMDGRLPTRPAAKSDDERGSSGRLN